MQPNQSRRRRRLKRVWKYNAFFLIVFLFLTDVSFAQDNKPIKRWVTGTVIATDTRAIPNTIVVNTRDWKGRDLTVGAQVLNDTEITVNGKSAALQSLKAGDKVSMVYLRETTRLVAKKIEVRR